MSDTARFVGSWQLLTQHSIYPDGRTIPSRGENPQGILIYDAVGNMAAQLMRTDDRADQYTDMAQLRTAMEGFFAYFGTYEVDEPAQIVRHRVIGAAYPGYLKTIQVRRYKFEDNLLTLTAASPADDSNRVLVWQRLSGPLTYPVRQE